MKQHARDGRSLRTVAIVLLLSPTGFAQLNNAWVTFQHDPNRIQAPGGSVATYITTSPDRKEFAVGDLNRDGWPDVVMVCKQQASTYGPRANYLLMNEGGTLVDRTAQWATASDVAGDQGFMTPTNDRDVQIVDLDMDGWPDVVTAVTLSDGQPKHISHPRVYINLGSSGGSWLGLRYEDARIPQLLTSAGLAVAPRFCSVSVGDVTGDGAPDLYFADHDGTETNISEPSSWDLNDRLLVNDGQGYFTDSGTSRMSSFMLLSDFGSSSAIADMNGDGVRDVVKNSTLSSPIYVSVAYNDPANVGYFNLFQTEGGGAPYHVNVGDLNKDGRPDLLVSEDSADIYRYNTGNDSLGRVIWGPAYVFAFVDGGHDDGFGGTNMVVDLDGDGWNDAIVTDVDVDLPGCARRCHIYHNPGGTIGQQITLVEEARQTGTGGWKGVVGMLASDLTGTNDVAVLDLDRDGDMDMVFGRCSGTFVWMNQQLGCLSGGPVPYGTAVADSTGLPGRIGSQGTSSKSANNLVLTCSQLPAFKTNLFFCGTTQLTSPLPFGNGLRWTGGSFTRLPAVQSDAQGFTSFACDFNASPLNALNPGDARYFQNWFRDPAAGGANFNVSDALTVIVCP